MALRVSVLHCPWTQDMQWGIAEFRRAFKAHADTRVAKLEAKAAGGADVRIELVAASFGDHPRFLGGVVVVEVFGRCFTRAERRARSFSMMAA